MSLVWLQVPSLEALPQPYTCDEDAFRRKAWRFLCLVDGGPGALKDGPSNTN
jgi:hypothetical protein